MTEGSFGHSGDAYGGGDPDAYGGGDPDAYGGGNPYAYGGSESTQEGPRGYRDSGIELLAWFIILPFAFFIGQGLSMSIVNEIGKAAGVWGESSDAAFWLTLFCWIVGFLLYGIFRKTLAGFFFAAGWLVIGLLLGFLAGTS